MEISGTSPVLDERHHAESHTISLKVESRRTGEILRIWTGICYSDISPLEIFFWKDHNLLFHSLTSHSTCWENLLTWTLWALPDNCGSSSSVCFQASSRVGAWREDSGKPLSHWKRITQREKRNKLWLYKKKKIFYLRCQILDSQKQLH